MHRLLALLLLCMSVALTACGGGGSSGGSGGGSGGGGSNRILSISPASVSLTAKEGIDGNTQQVRVSWSDANVAGVVFGTLPNENLPTWLNLEVTGNSNPATLQFSTNPGLSQGTYRTTIRAVAGDSNQNVLETRDIPVTYTVTAPPVFEFQQGDNSVVRTVVGELRPVPSSIDFVTEGDVNWFVYSETGKLRIEPSSGTGSTTLQLYAQLGDAAGSYTENVVAQEGLHGKLTTSTGVTINVMNPLEADSEKLTFSMAEGGDLPDTQTVNVSGDDIQWDVSVSEPWLSVTPTSGVGSGAVMVDVTSNELASAGYNATITIADNRPGFEQSWDVDVELLVEPRLLKAERVGVALTNTPTLSVLSKDVVIFDNGDGGLAWTATSSQSWLNVTSSGQTGDALTLTADPTGLTTETVHYADITVTSEDAANSQIIKTAFWVGNRSANARDGIQMAYVGMGTDTIRPYAYAGDAMGNVDVYNIHTATRIATIPVGAAIGQFIASDDGSTIYAVEKARSVVIPITVGDGPTFTIGTEFDVGAGRHTFGRVNGHPFLFSSGGSIYDLAAGAPLDFDLTSVDRFRFSGGYTADVSRNGESYCAIDTGRSPSEVSCFGLEYSRLNGGRFNATLDAVITYDGNGRDIAVSHDGQRVYPASGGGYPARVFSTKDGTQLQTLQVEPYPNNAEIGPDGLFYNGLSNDAEDVYIFKDNGTIDRPTVNLSSGIDNMLTGTMAVSADGSRVFALTDDFRIDSELRFISVK